MKKINVEKIIAVSGMPGLYKVISNGTKGIIIENILDKKRTIVLNNSKVYSLDTIRLFVNEGELPIQEALYKLYEHLNGQAAPHHKTSSDDEIVSVFEKAIPNYDKERVYIHNMRKLFQWYNLLKNANMLTVVEENENDEPQEVQKTSSQEPVAIEDTTARTQTKKSSAKSKKTASSEPVTSEETATPKKRGRKKKTDNE